MLGEVIVVQEVGSCKKSTNYGVCEQRNAVKGIMFKK